MKKDRSAKETSQGVGKRQVGKNRERYILEGIFSHEENLERIHGLDKKSPGFESRK